MSILQKKNPPQNLLFDNAAIRRLIIPLFIEQFLAIFVGLADSIMVASVGEAAVSAVSLIDQIMILLINVFSAFATGGAIIAGQALGRKHQDDACETSEQTLLLAFSFSIVIMAFLYIGRGFILHVVFGKIEPDVMRNCSLYLMIVASSIPFLAVYNTGAAMFRSMGDSRTPMLMSLVMNGINLAGNAVLLYGLKFGIEGAAIPTAFSRMFAGVWMLFLMQNTKKTVHIRKLAGLRFNFRLQKKILHIAIPFSLENSMFQLGKIMVLSLVSGFGTSSIAANAVSNSIASFAILGGASMSMALSAVAAQCVGAGDYDQVRYYTRRLLRDSYGALLLMNVIILILLPVIIHVYNLSPETGVIAKRIILYHAVCSVLVWPVSFTLPNTLRAADDVTFCMVVAIASMWICRIGMSYIIAKYMGVGVLGIWIAMTMDWVVRAVLFIFRYRGTKWMIHSPDRN